MKKTELINFANTITSMNISLHKQTKAGKWYECEYSKDFTDIELNTTYGVCINGNSIDFDFKTGKNEDTIYKTFITQFINKYEMKRVVLIDGEIRTKTKQECLQEFKNSNRINKYFFYTTLYGIGFFSYFMNNDLINDTVLSIGKYLKENNITFKNETSEAGWVTRLVIKKDIQIHNNLLENYNL